MRKEIEVAFNQCLNNNCYEEQTDELIYISDLHETEPCCVVNTEEEAHLVVKNPDQKIISFIKIDKCLFFDDSEHQKCDCAIFDESIFCFIEIKNTIRARQRKKHRRKAREQLMVTINIFQERLDLSKYEQQAIICFTFKPARPLVSTSSQEAAIIFQDQFNVALLEGNELAF